MGTILQTAFWKTFYWMKILTFWWALFLGSNSLSPCDAICNGFFFVQSHFQKECWPKPCHVASLGLNELIPVLGHWTDYEINIFMPTPLGTRGIIFSGCLFVCPSFCSSIHPTDYYPDDPPTNTLFRPSVCPQRFRAFFWECMGEMACNWAWWCILSTFRTD